MSARPTIAMTFPTTLGVLGGGTIGCVKIVRALQHEGARVVLFLAQTRILNRGVFRVPPLEPEYRGTELETELRDEGVEIIAVPPARPHVFLDCWPMRRAVQARLAAEPFDAVLGWHHELAMLPPIARAHGAMSGMFVAGWYNRFRDKEIAQHDLKERTKLRAERWFLAKGLRRVDKVLAISKWSKQEITEVFALDPGRVGVVYWGVDPIFAEAQRSPPGPVTNFLFFGSQAGRKGALEAMEAFARIASQGNRDWTYKLVWLHTQRVCDKAEELGIADRVIAMDPTDHQGLVRELEWAHVAVLPSLFESFGLACAEALTSGVPVIAYDCAGVPEVVRHGEDGWLVPNGRKDLLDAPIIEAMADPARTHRMGTAGRERMLAGFTWQRTAQALLRMIEDQKRA